MPTAVVFDGIIDSGASTSTLFFDVPSNNPPLDPTNPTVAGNTTTTIPLTWGAGSDPGGTVVGYNVYLVVGTNETRYGSNPTTTTTSYTVTGLAEGTSYSFRIKTVDDGGLESTGVDVSGSTTSSDTTAPSTPTSFVEGTVTSTGFPMTWTASTDPTVSGQTTSGVSYYEIFDTGLNFYTTVNHPTTTVNVTGLTAGTTYQMRCKAYDAAGNASQPAMRAVTTSSGADTVDPSAPGTLTSPSKTATTVNLAWGAATDNVGVDHYRVLRSNTSGGTFTKISTDAVQGTTLTYQDSNLTASTTYYYKVRAVDAAGNLGPFSNELQVTTNPATVDTTRPSNVTGFTSPSQTDDDLSLTWNAATDNVGVDHYEVWISGDRTNTQETATGTSLTYSGGTVDLAPSTNYALRIVAVDAAGNESATPAQLTAQTSAQQTVEWPVFGIVWGGNGTTASASDFMGILPADHKMRMWRLGIDWPNFTPPYPDGSMTGPLAEFDHMFTLGTKGMVGLNYVRAEYQRKLPLGNGTIVKNGTGVNQCWIELDTPVPWGPTDSGSGTVGTDVRNPRRGGKWQNVVVGGVDQNGVTRGTGLTPPGLNAGVLIQGSDDEPAGSTVLRLSADRRRVYLDATSGTVTDGGTGLYYVGGSHKGITEAVHAHVPPGSADATDWDELAPSGVWAYRSVKILNGAYQGNTRQRLRAVELGNEIQWGLGARPWADPQLSYLNWCHMYCGAKKAQPNIIVYQGAPAARIDRLYQHYPDADHWNEHLHTFAVSSGRAYFRNLHNTMFGVDPPNLDPWQVLNLHVYGLPPQGSQQKFNSAVAAVYNTWNDDGVAKPNGAFSHYKIALTEFGPAWRPVSQAVNLNSGSGGYEYGHDWVEGWYGYSSGNVAWPVGRTTGEYVVPNFRSQLGATYGTNLSSATLATRKAAARNIFDISTHFCLQFPATGDFGENAFYATSGQAGRRFNLTDGIRDVATFYRDDFPS